MKAPNKQEWIKEEHQKAVQVHWDNIDRIKKLKDEQSTKIYIPIKEQSTHFKMNFSQIMIMESMSYQKN